jgi:hypothetical protein
MSANRWFNLIVISTLVVTAVLTIAGALATAQLVSAAPVAASCPRAMTVSSGHIQGTYVVTGSNSVPTGIEGGLLALLSGDRTCSK